MKSFVLPWALCLGIVLGNQQAAYAKIFREVEIIGLSYIQKNDLKDMLLPYVGKEFNSAQRQRLEKDFAAISMFASVSFKVTYNNILRLIVQERVPLATTTFRQQFFVDPQGHLFQWFGSSVPPMLPVIEGDWKTKTQFRASVDVFPDSIVLLQDIEQFLDVSPKRLFWHQALGWSFVWQDGFPEVYLGTRNFPSKLKKLARVAEELMSQKDKILRVDCNFHDRIVVKLRPTEDS